MLCKTPVEIIAFIGVLKKMKILNPNIFSHENNYIIHCNLFITMRTNEGFDKYCGSTLQSVPIITNVVSSNPAHAGCTRYKLCDEVCQ